MPKPKSRKMERRRSNFMAHTIYIVRWVDEQSRVCIHPNRPNPSVTARKASAEASYKEKIHAEP